jgi:hypothetical protein
VESFQAEAERHDVNLLVCRFESNEPLLPWKGLRGDQVYSFLANSASGFRGTLVTGLFEHWEYHFSNFSRFGAEGKPVVWFDQQESVQENPPGVRRFAFSEHAMAETAVKYLHGLGHRKCLWIGMDQQVAWETRRLANCSGSRKIGRKCGVFTQHIVH